MADRDRHKKISVTLAEILVRLVRLMIDLEVDLDRGEAMTDGAIVVWDDDESFDTFLLTISSLVRSGKFNDLQLPDAGDAAPNDRAIAKWLTTYNAALNGIPVELLRADDRDRAGDVLRLSKEMLADG